MNWSWLLPEPVSRLGSDIDFIYYVILAITGAIFLLVEVALIVFVIRYRRKEGRKAAYTHGHTKLEVVWTLVPFVLVLVIAFMSMNVWLEAKAAERTRVAEEAYPIRVAAKQFEWNITYPGPDERLDTDDDFTKRNQLQVPVGRGIRVELTSEDVIHSFFLPDFRVKQDAVPGMMIPVWFQPTRTGEFPLGCAELCGLGHYRMKGSVTVLEGEDYDRWVAEEAGGAPAPAPAPAPADTAQVEMEGESR